MTETWWSIFTDPNHIVAELLWTLLQDILIGWLLYGVLWKKVMLPKIHAKFDEQHGLTHKGEK
jgi:hypothetical protein